MVAEPLLKTGCVGELTPPPPNENHKESRRKGGRARGRENETRHCSKVAASTAGLENAREGHRKGWARSSSWGKLGGNAVVVGG